MGRSISCIDGNICDIVKDCDFAHGTQIAPKYATDLTFANLAGAPTGTVTAPQPRWTPG